MNLKVMGLRPFETVHQKKFDKECSKISARRK